MNRFEKKRRNFPRWSINTFVVTKLSDFQVQSGAKITCAKFGGDNFQLMAAGDD
jgi:hypothetical protein